MTAGSSSDAASDRIDRWLWHARFFKTRTLSSEKVSGGKIRLNGNRVTKPATPVRFGDTLTIAQGKTIRVVTVQGIGTRRGPASEAEALYEDHDRQDKDTEWSLNARDRRSRRG